jgi:hypothetical protein
MLDVSKNFKDAVYAPIRKFTARLTFTLLGFPFVYDDKYIISINVLEEMSVLNNTMPSNELKITLDNTNKDFDFLNLQNMQAIIASRPKIAIEFGIVYENGTIEWVKMGDYYLIEWKNETAAMSISLIGRDNLDMLSQISYNNLVSNTLYNLVVDIFTKAGITNYSIDDSLKTISGKFVDRLDSRSALQHIGVASKSAVYQDRNGVMIIKPFKVLDQSNNYLSFAGTQRSALGGMYTGASAFPAVLSGFDMKIINYDNIFQEPEVSLYKSIYEVVINIYEAAGTREVVYINNSIAGKNGASFKIDNPLINNAAQAADVAAWIISESNWNAAYKTIWRQNPVLECADIILVEDSFQAKKQTRIVKQEFEYAGYLRGNTESRGGI